MAFLTTSLFYLLSPGILLRLPKNGSKMAVAATHAVIFGLAYYFIHTMISNSLHEGFKSVKVTSQNDIDARNKAAAEKVAAEKAAAEKAAAERAQAVAAQMAVQAAAKRKGPK